MIRKREGAAHGSPHIEKKHQPAKLENGWGVGQARVRYVDAGTTYRVIYTRAVEAGLTGREWRVLGAVFYLTVSYSKLNDETFLSQIMQLSDIRDRRVVQKTLARLRPIGVVWQPQAGKGRRSSLSLKGGSTAPSLDNAKGGVSEEKRRSSTTPKGGRPRPPYLEVFREIQSEEPAEDFQSPTGAGERGVGESVASDEVAREYLGRINKSLGIGEAASPTPSPQLPTEENQ